MPSYLWYKKCLDGFVESEHPRDEDGKFTDKNGGGSSGGSIESHIENTKGFVYQGGKVDLKGATNPENISLMNDALDEVQKKYPFHLEEISTFSSRGVRLAQAEGTHKLQVAKHFINMTEDQKKEFYKNNSSNYKNIIQNSIDNFRTKYLENDKVPSVVKMKAEKQIKQWEKDLRYERHNAISSPDMISPRTPCPAWQPSPTKTCRIRRWCSGRIRCWRKPPARSRSHRTESPLPPS